MYEISVGESRPHKSKIVANLIMSVESTDHSHTFVSWKDAYGLRWVAEARGNGVQILSNVEFKMTNEITALYTYSTEQEERFQTAVRYVWDKSLSSYGFRQLLGLSYMRVANKMLRSIGMPSQVKNPYRDGEFSQICCEFSIRTACTMMNRVVPTDVDNFGLIETHAFNQMYGDRKPQGDVDRINANGRRQLAEFRARLKGG